MSTYSRVRANGFPNGAAVPALDHLRARHPEAEHEATLREVVEGERVHRARRSGVRAEICTIDVPSRMVEVCDPHQASGPNASRAPGLGGEHGVEAEALRLEDPLEGIGRRLAPQYPSVSPSFIRADPSSANVAGHPRTRSRGGLGCADRAMDVARGGGSGCASTSCCSLCSP